MIQTVGIKFEAQGLESVTAQMRTLSQSLSNLVGSLGKLEAMGTSNALTGLGSVATRIEGAASKLQAAATQLSTASKSLHVASTGPAIPHSQPASKPTSVGIMGGESAFGVAGAAATMARYGAAGALMYGTYTLAKEMLLATGRQDYQKPMMELTAVGIRDIEDKKYLEARAQSFADRFPALGKSAEHLSSYSDVASDIEVGNPLKPAFNKEMIASVQENIALYGALASMDPKTAAKSALNVVMPEYFKSSPEMKARYENEVGLFEAMAEKKMGLMQATIDVTRVTGPKLDEYLKHSYAPLKDQGWDDASIMSLGGMYSSAGQRESSSGRAAKSIFDARRGLVGTMLLLGHEDKKIADAATKMSQKDRERLGRQLYDKKWAEVEHDPIKMLRSLSHSADVAKGRNYDISDFVGRDFLAQGRLALDKNVQDEWERRRAEIVSIAPSRAELAKRVEQTQKDEPGFTTAALSVKYDNLTKALGDRPNEGSLAGDLTMVAGGMIDGMTFLAQAIAGNTQAHDKAAGWWDQFKDWTVSNEKRTQMVRDIAEGKEAYNELAGKYQWNTGLPFARPTQYEAAGGQMFLKPPPMVIQAEPSIRQMTPEERTSSQTISGKADFNVTIDLQNPPPKVELSKSVDMGNSTARRGAENLQMMHQ